MRRLHYWPQIAFALALAPLLIASQMRLSYSYLTIGAGAGAYVAANTTYIVTKHRFTLIRFVEYCLVGVLAVVIGSLLVR